MAARRRTYGGANRERYVKAKAQYQKDKVTLGSREAKKIFNKVKAKNVADYEKSQEYLNNKEFAMDLLGTFALHPVLSGIARERTIRKSVK